METGSLEMRKMRGITGIQNGRLKAEELKTEKGEK
jgi:hypothetical protein